MSAEPYTPGYTALMKDEPVVKEFERLAAYLAGMREGAITDARTQAGLVNGQVVSIKSGAAFRLYKSGVPQTIAAGAQAAVTWDTESVDTDNFFPGSGSVITITVPGTYVITAHVGPPNGGFLLALSVNGHTVVWAKQNNIAWLGQFVGGESVTVYAYAVQVGVSLDTALAGIEGYQLQSSAGAIVVPGTGGVGTGTGTAPADLPALVTAPVELPTYAISNWWGGRANGQDTTYDLIGTGINNATALGTPAVNNQVSSTFTKYTSGAVIAQTAGVHLVSNVGVQVRHGPTFIAKIKTGSVITAVRYWIGLTETVFTNADEVAGAHYAAFRYSTVVPDTGWVGVVRDGNAALQSVTAKVADILADTEYLLKIRVASDGLTAYFSVDGGTEVSIATNLPPVTVNLGFAIMLVTTEGVAKHLSISRHFCTFGT
jgi:hypothetical protein